MNEERRLINNKERREYERWKFISLRKRNTKRISGTNVKIL